MISMKAFSLILFYFTSAALVGCSSVTSLECQDGALKGGSVFVDVKHIKEAQGECANPSGSSLNWGVAFDSFLRVILRERGFVCVFDESKAEVIAKCRYDIGYCIPYGGRNFRIHCTTVRWFVLEFIRKRDNKVIGVVRYRRPLIAFHPSNTFMEGLLVDLIDGRALESAKSE